MTDAPDPELAFAEAVERLRAKTGSPEKGRGNLLDREPAAVGDLCDCRCNQPACSNRWRGQAIWKSDLTRTVDRCCDACAAKAETRNTARLAEMSPSVKRPSHDKPSTYKDSEPIRKVFGIDD